MMPMNQPMPDPRQGPNPGVPVGPGPAAQGPDSGNPDQIKAQLKMLLTKAKEVAEKNGVNFSEIVSEVEGNNVKSDVPLPRPPSAGPPKPNY
jgi:hypothetical protein